MREDSYEPFLYERSFVAHVEVRFLNGVGVSDMDWVAAHLTDYLAAYTRSLTNLRDLNPEVVAVSGEHRASFLHPLAGARTPFEGMVIDLPGGDPK
jgi:hypothetical protein